MQSRQAAGQLWIIIADGAATNKIWLPTVTEELVARGITRVLVEGGPGMWRAFADASLVDEVVLYMTGQKTDEIAARAAIARQLGPLELELNEKRTLEPDTMWRLRRTASKRGP